MKENLLLVLKGIIIGAGKIIPGVSGAMLAMVLGVYDKGIKAIGNFFKDFNKNFIFLFMLSIGMVFSIVVISKFVKFFLENYYLPTMLLFVGLIAGGVPSVVKQLKDKKSFKNIILMIVPLVLTIFLSLTSKDNVNSNQVDLNFIVMVLIGMIDAFTMIVPGVSGTAVLMMLGYYDIVINAFSAITDLSLFLNNMTVLVPFVFGLILGVVLLAKLVDYLLEYHRDSSYALIVGFAISSIMFLFRETFMSDYDFTHILLGLFLLVFGYLISKKLDNFN